MTTSTSASTPVPTELLEALRILIQQGRQQALRAVDMVQVQTCWEVGRHIVEFEQGGEVRAAYGKRLLSRLAEALTGEFGKGFDASNLRYMRLFFQAFPIRDALRHELSWTHYRLLLPVVGDDEDSELSTGLNTILYGPPGTGKTFTAIDEAIKILDPEFYAK